MPTLQEKFTGCIGASWIGSSMGAVVEGWSREEIEDEFGWFDELVAYERRGREREPGTTEDGIERQRAIATAIIENEGKIKPHDLVEVWIRDNDKEKMQYRTIPFDWALLDMARAGVPPVELGRLWPWPNVVSMARASHPIGLLNAGDPEGAAEDSIEVGKVYASETDFSLRWAALYNAAVAEACAPDATVESVLDTAREFATYRAESGSLYSRYDTIEDEVEAAIELGREYDDPMAMRDVFYDDDIYTGGHYVTYGISLANEIVAKGLAVFALTEGDPEEAIEVAVNFGRDTDCLAAVAGGLAGALRGPDPLREEWIDQVNDAVQRDEYTNSQRTIEETADGLLDANVAHRRELAAHFDRMGNPGAPASE